MVVGGVAAGASAAARLRRLDETAEIIVFERGEHISFANCGLPYYVGGVIEQRQNLLLQTPASMKHRFNLDVRVMSEVIAIHPAEKTVEVYQHLTDERYQESYDYLILAPGATPLTPRIQGLEHPNVFTVRNVPDSDYIKQYIQQNRAKTAAVIGAGFIGLEMAEMLHQAGLKVTILEASSQVMQALDPEMAAFIHRYIEYTGIALHLNRRAVSLQGRERVEQVLLDNDELIPADLVILGAGVKPETALAQQAGLALGSTGGILVDEHLRTSDPYIYAGGDAIQVKDIISGEETLLPLAGPANRQGWIIANNICGRSLTYPGVQGTSILKFLQMTAAVTGESEKRLKKSGRPYLAIHTHPNSHATYYPGATPMTIKLLFTPEKGKVLGAQIVGYDGVDKRIDVLATAIRAGMTVFDLQELELAYAPPFSSAKDPVNLTAYAAANLLNGDIDVVHWPQVPERTAQGSFLIDVRTPGEFAHSQAPGAYNIPVDEIRERLQEIPRDREILLYCHVGIRSYIAARILRQLGYQAVNISGGYRLFEVQQ